MIYVDSLLSDWMEKHKFTVPMYCDQCNAELVKASPIRIKGYAGIESVFKCFHKTYALTPIDEKEDDFWREVLGQKENG